MATSNIRTHHRIAPAALPLIALIALADALTPRALLNARPGVPPLSRHPSATASPFFVRASQYSDGMDYRSRLIFQAGLPQFYVNLAIARASQRLEHAECTQLLEEFRDGGGSPLAAHLEALGQTPVQFLADLWWFDASDSDRCQGDTVTAAFTRPGSRAIFVCGARFADPAFSLNGVWGEMVVIHEMLHALGLGENPPTSAEITRRVFQRCSECPTKRRPDPRRAG